MQAQHAEIGAGIVIRQIRVRNMRRRKRDRPVVIDVIAKRQLAAELQILAQIVVVVARLVIARHLAEFDEPALIQVAGDDQSGADEIAVAAAPELPQALAAAGADVRLLLPGLPAILAGLGKQSLVCDIGPLFGAGRVRLLRGVLAPALPVYVVDAPYLYERPGNPYLAADGTEWADNLQRFALLGWVAAHVAAGELDPDWQPDVLHVQGVDVADDIGNLDRVIGDPDNPDPNRPFVLVGVVSENG